MKFNNETIREAVNEWLENEESAETKYGHISNWDTSGVTDMTKLFHNANTFNNPIDSWNVSNVVKMNGMFAKAQCFNQPLEKWNVSSVTHMNGMFSDAHSFNQPLEKWDVSNVTVMWLMFRNTQCFNQPLEKWNVSKVTQMSKMFYNANSFNQPINNWDVSNVTNMKEMFYDAKAFNQSLEKWNVLSLNDSRDMFLNANKDMIRRYGKDGLVKELIEIMNAFDEASTVYRIWDEEPTSDGLMFNFVGSDMGLISRENSGKPSLITPAENLVKISKTQLPKLREELEEEKLFTFYDLIVNLVISLTLKHTNNHKTIKGDIECCYLFNDIFDFPMFQETKKVHNENHDIIFKKTIYSESPFSIYEDRKDKLINLYNTHKGKKPIQYDGPPKGKDKSLNSGFKTPSLKTGDIDNLKTTGSSNGGCYIATMVYGNYNHPQVMVLRGFRDEVLSNYLLGKLFIRFYYKYSPTWVKVLENNKLFNNTIKKTLNIIINMIK
jgi:surface protein